MQTAEQIRTSKIAPLPRSGELIGQIRDFLRDFSLNPMNSASKLRSLLAQDAGNFYRAAIEVFAEEKETHPGIRAVAKMIASDETFLDKLEEKAAHDLDAAIRVGQHLLDADRSVTQSLLYRVNAAEAESDLDRANRLLSIVGTINQAVGNVMPLVPLTCAHDSRIRSKAMLLVGKVVRRSEWLKKALSDPDPRVRANAIEAVWGGVSEDLVPLLERSLEDKHPRVVGNGAGVVGIDLGLLGVDPRVHVVPALGFLLGTGQLVLRHPQLHGAVLHHSRLGFRYGSAGGIDLLGRLRHAAARGQSQREHDCRHAPQVAL